MERVRDMKKKLIALGTTLVMTAAMAMPVMAAIDFETAKLRPDFVKLHLLHVLKDTPLCELYSSGKYTPMDRQLYIETICRQIELFHPETVIARVTGDAPSDSLVAPLWCSKKTSVTNDIDKYLFEHNMYQGKALII